MLSVVEGGSPIEYFPGHGKSSLLPLFSFIHLYFQLYCCINSNPYL